MSLSPMDQSVLLGIIVICGGIIIGWAQLKKDSKWHTEWIQNHVVECKQRAEKQTERDEENSNILHELRIVNTRLATLVDAHHESIKNHDEEIKRIREKLHDLGNTVNIRSHKP